MQFSVLLSVYKGENPEWLKQSINSIYFEQTLKPSEIIMVLDGPLTSELYTIVSFLKSKIPIIKTIEFEVNRGLGNALYEGLKSCSYEIVARMDADDIAVSNRFERQIEYLSTHTDVDIVGSFAKNIDFNGNISCDRMVPVSHSQIVSLMWTCPFIHPSVMFKKSLVLASGSYSKTLKRRQDYDLWFRCAIKGAHFANIAEYLLFYRITDDTYKRNSFKVAYNQAKIGFLGFVKLGLGFKAILGVFYPLLKSILPLSLRKLVEKTFYKYDPRR